MSSSSGQPFSSDDDLSSALSPALSPDDLRALRSVPEASPQTDGAATHADGDVPGSTTVAAASGSDITSTGLSGTKRRLVEHLKRRDSATAAELAAVFGLTDTALRQHLDGLAAMGYVERVAIPAQRRGRPPQHWRLTAAATALFPDGHSDFTLELIASLRDALGDDGVQSVVTARADRQIRAYTSAMPVRVDLSTRVRHLAELRSAEGYLAEAVTDGADVLLVEHHCPIGGAAHACNGICETELQVFQRVLGDDVSVSRETHLLAGDRRCTYRIAPRDTASSGA